MSDIELSFSIKGIESRRITDALLGLISQWLKESITDTLFTFQNEVVIFIRQSDQLLLNPHSTFWDKNRLEKLDIPYDFRSYEII